MKKSNFIYEFLCAAADIVHPTNPFYLFFCFVKVDIYFTAIGLFDIPTEQELLKAVEERKNHKQHTKKSA